MKKSAEMNRKIRTDAHIHTTYSGHSAPDMTVAAIVRRAEELGLDGIAITEHCFEWEPINHAPEIRRELAAVKPALPVRVGLEICPNPRQPGRLCFEELNPGELFPVLTGFHSWPAFGYAGAWDAVLHLDASDKQRIRKIWMKTMALLAANPRVDILAHPGRILTQNGILEEFDRVFLREFEEVLDAAKEHGVAVEMNESAFARFQTERLRESYLDVFRLAREKEVKISFGSDAHRPDAIGQFPLVEKAAGELRLNPSDLFLPNSACLPCPPKVSDVK